jgi:hypothetical protein
MKTLTIEISAVAFKEGNCWIAQGLEYDISAQANTLNELHKKFMFSVAANLAVCVELGRAPLEGIGRAPEEYWEMFRAAEITINRPLAAIVTPLAIPAINSTMRLMETHAA